MREATYLQRVHVLPDRIASPDEHPFSLPVVRNLDLVLRHRITFLIGENGSGKSTIMEAIAEVLGLPLSGGGTTDIGLHHGPRVSSRLGPALRTSFRRRPRDAYFFRGELATHFAALLDARRDDPDFLGNPYARYGGRSLREQSHGEGFLAVMKNRIGDGLYLLDEPEVALSPQRQLALMSLVASHANDHGAQFVIATHSPILMTIPGAEILQIEDGAISPIRLQDTLHYQVTRGILENPDRFWRHMESTDESS